LDVMLVKAAVSLSVLQQANTTAPLDLYLGRHVG